MTERSSDTDPDDTGISSFLARRAAIVLLAVMAAFALAACTGNPLRADPTTHDTTRILGRRVFVTVTTDGGRELIARRDIPLERGMTALDALAQVADVRLTTGGAVAQVNGLGGGRLTTFGPEPAAWLFRVNGVESGTAADRIRLRAGQAVWWDLRRYDIFRRIPVSIGEFPEPFFTGYRDNRRPLQVTWAPGFEDDARLVRDMVFQQLDPEMRPTRDRGGITGVGGMRSGPVPIVAVRKERANVVIGRWEQVRLDPYLADVAADPRGWGITTWIEGTEVREQGPQDELSRVVRGAEGVVWATTIDGEPDSALVLVVTGITDEGVRGALKALMSGGFQYRLAGAVDSDGAVVHAAAS